MTTRSRTFCFWLTATLVAADVVAADSVISQSQTTKPSPVKSYQIRNKKYGELLRPQEANSADGTPIVLYPAQPWKCMTWTLNPVGESRFQLQNQFTSKTFAAGPASDQTQAAVAQVPLGRKPEERPTWQVTKLSDGMYKITDPKTGKALTAVKEANRSGVKIVVQVGNEGEDQKWELIEIDPKTLTM